MMATLAFNGLKSHQVDLKLSTSSIFKRSDSINLIEQKISTFSLLLNSRNRIRSI